METPFPYFSKLRARQRQYLWLAGQRRGHLLLCLLCRMIFRPAITSQRWRPLFAQQAAGAR